MKTCVWVAGPAMVVAVASCSAQGGPTVVESPSTVVQSGSPSASASDDGRTWDPNQWKPTVTIALRQYSDADRMQKRTEWLKSLAPKDVKVPEIKLIRWTNGWADYGEALAKCLNERGFTVQADGGGVRIPDGVPSSQEQAFELANYVCSAQYSVDPAYTGD